MGKTAEVRKKRPGFAEAAKTGKHGGHVIRKAVINAAAAPLQVGAEMGAKTAYLTKQILLSAVSKGIKAAASATMELQGYNVVAEDGWVVKVYADGTKEKIKKIATVKRPAHITLHK